MLLLIWLAVALIAVVTMLVARANMRAARTWARWTLNLLALLAALALWGLAVHGMIEEVWR